MTGSPLGVSLVRASSPVVNTAVFARFKILLADGGCLGSISHLLFFLTEAPPTPISIMTEIPATLTRCHDTSCWSYFPTNHQCLNILGRPIILNRPSSNPSTQDMCRRLYLDLQPICSWSQDRTAYPEVSNGLGSLMLIGKTDGSAYTRNSHKANIRLKQPYCTQMQRTMVSNWCPI